ncbi:hypothetical protein [Prevotella sp.]|uniref:hypothetical protein n=1 Tax=Prevotella sp. TaxID=59823 RepID=UPI003AB739BD
MIQKILLKGARKIYRSVVHPDFIGNPWPKDEEWETTNTLLTDLFSDDKPCFVGRIGTTEQAVLVNYITVHSKKNYIKKCLDYITDNTRLPFWDYPRLSDDLCMYSGFFPKRNLRLIERFAELYLHDIPSMDVCGRFSYAEKFLPFNKDCKMVQLESLYPFFSKKPWMKVFEDKKVLVVHPFKDTILSQYNNHRSELFKNKDILPKFHLEVIKAVQTIAGEKSNFTDWFEALDYMKDEISKHDFDLLIVGCGAYGLPLAAFAKSLGKKSIHLGGGTQLLFGIKGKRWEGHYHGNDMRFNNLFNEYWVYPSDTEKPKNANKIEGGCYW